MANVNSLKIALQFWSYKQGHPSCALLIFNFFFFKCYIKHFLKSDNFCPSFLFSSLYVMKEPGKNMFKEIISKSSGIEISCRESLFVC